MFLSPILRGLPALARWRIITGRPPVEMTEAEKDAACDRFNRRERLGPYRLPRPAGPA